jgi:RNA-binding protein
MVELSSDEVEELRGRAQDLDAVLRVGKSGLSAGFLDELETALGRDGLVKVRLLRSSVAGTSPEEMAETMAERTGAALVETRGNTAVLYDPAGDR